MGAKVKWVERRHSWYVYVYAKGTEKAKRLGPTSADKRRGERLAKEINRRQARGDLGLEKPKGKSVPFDEFAQEWFRTKVELPAKRSDGDLAPKTVAIRDQMVRLHLVPFLGSRDIRSISIATIDELSDHLLEKTRQQKKTKKGTEPKPPRLLSRRTRDMAIGVLRMILNHARVRHGLNSNAVIEWKEYQPRGSRSSKLKPIESLKVLTTEEREAFLSTGKSHFPERYPFILFLAETGCRFSEAVNLRWSDVDLEGGVAEIRRLKTGGDPTQVELSETLKAVLRLIRPHIFPPDLLAFPTRSGGPIRYSNFRCRVFDPLVREVLGEGRRFTPHCLRHTWASLHLARGTPITWIKEQGGWASSKMLLDVYGHFIPHEMRGHANNLAPEHRNRPEQASSSA